jgi:hypothetical protein
MSRKTFDVCFKNEYNSEGYCLPERETAQFGTQAPTFRRNVETPSLGLNGKLIAERP